MERSSREIASFLARVRRAMALGVIRFTDYAYEGIEALGWQREDALLQLIELSAADFHRCEDGRERPGLIWVFTPDFWEGGMLRIRLIERHGVVVISFHKG